MTDDARRAYLLDLTLANAALATALEVGTLDDIRERAAEMARVAVEIETADLAA